MGRAQGIECRTFHPNRSRHFTKHLFTIRNKKEMCFSLCNHLGNSLQKRNVGFAMNNQLLTGCVFYFTFLSMNIRNTLSKTTQIIALLSFSMLAVGCGKKSGPLPPEIADKLNKVCTDIKKNLTSCSIPQFQSLLADQEGQKAFSGNALFSLDCTQNVAVLVSEGKYDAEDLIPMVEECQKMFDKKKINCGEVNLCMTAVLINAGKMAASAKEEKLQKAAQPTTK